MSADQKSQVSRRNFLKTTSVAALGAGLTGCTTGGRMGMTAKSASRVLGANDRPNMAIIGCGTIGNSHLQSILALRKEGKVEIQAVCDVWDTRAKEFQKLVKTAGGSVKAFHDYHDVLAMKDLDYVAVTVPEHWHCPIALDALDAGKHVYCEKPVTHTIEEANLVMDKVKETGLKLQVGVQGMSDDSYITAREAILEGKIGNVVQAQIEYCRDYPPQRGPWRKKDTPNYKQKPEDLDWITWLGHAPKRAWDPHRYFEWRNYKDYSGGISTDLFVHRISRIIKACNLTWPTRVCGMGGIYSWPDGRDLPDSFEMMAEYAAVDGITRGMTVHVLGTMANRHGIEHLIRGDKATLIFFRKQGWKIVEWPTNKVLFEHKISGAEDIRLHHLNLHEAMRGNAELNCPVELGHYGLSAVAMANQSWFDKKMIGFDAKQRRAFHS